MQYLEYMEKVKSLLEREQRDEVVLLTIVKRFHDLGEKYFGNSQSGYAGCDDIDEDDISGITTYNKEEFIAQVVEEMGEETAKFYEETDEVAFSDSYRHAGLIDVKTLEVIDPASLDIPMDDHVFTWSVIQNIPAKLSGTNYVALHFDNEGLISLFFPMPTINTVE